MNNTFILTEQSTFEMAIKALDEGGIGFLAIIDQAKTLLGVLTDGDIRRSFLRKEYNLNAIINKSPAVMNESSSRQEIISKLKQLHRRHMPLVDINNKLVRIFSLDEVTFITRKNPVVIMAGGLGSRLGELTQQTPKPMLTVGNRPMLQHLIEQFRDQGFSHFIICVNYKKEIICDYFANGAMLGVYIEYIEEEKRLGTAGALSLIEPKIALPYFVINADILTNIDFMALLNFHIAKKSLATMCVREYTMQVPYGVVNSDEENNLVTIDEKPQLSFNVNAGVYVLDPSIATYIPNNTFFDMPALFENVIQQGKPSAVYPINDYWLDIGRKTDLEQANIDLQLDKH